MIPRHGRRVAFSEFSASDFIDIPLIDDEPWMAEGSCYTSEVHFDWFFPENKTDENHAKDMCSACPVAWECLDLSIRKQEIHGIYGGMNFTERCALTHRFRGHTSYPARAAHRRHMVALNRRKQSGS